MKMNAPEFYEEINNFRIEWIFMGNLHRFDVLFRAYTC